MAPMKRPASAKLAGVSKKPALSAMRDQRSLVKKAVLSAESYPESLLNMLTNIVSDCLGVAKEQRHPFQEQVIQMVGEVLSSVEAGINVQITEAEQKVGKVDAEKSSKDHAEEAANIDLVAKAEAVEAAKAVLAESQDALKAAKVVHATAEAEKHASDADLETAVAQKQKLESGFTGIFTPLKEGTAADGNTKDAVAAVIKLGKQVKFDSALLTTLPSALSKAPDVRGTFDALVITQAEEELRKGIAELTEIITTREPRKAECEAKVQAASAELAATTEKEQSDKLAFKNAQDAKKEAEATQKAAIKAVKSFAPEMKEATKELDAAKASLEELKVGALAAFTELVERSAIPTPEPEDEAPPPGEGAPVAELPAIVQAEP